MRATDEGFTGLLALILTAIGGWRTEATYPEQLQKTHINREL